MSVLPIGTLLAPRLTGATSERGAVVVGATMLAGGLLTLAYLPGIQPAWVAAGLALCGLGFGALVHTLNRHALPLGSGERAATVTSVARHLGLVLGLAIIAPVLASQVTTAAETAPLPATKAMLDAPIDGPTKIRIALDIRDLLDDASDGEVPDLQGVFDRHGAGDEPRDRPAPRRHRARRAGGAHPVVPRLVHRRRRVRPARRGRGPRRDREVLECHGAHAGSTPRRRIGVGIVGITLAASVLLPAGAVHAGADDFGSPGVADPCTAPPDPFPGDGFDAAAQRFVLSGLNGAACELGISREELVLSLEPRSGVDVEWDRDTITEALQRWRQSRPARRGRAWHVARLGGRPTSMDDRPRTAVLVPRAARGGVMRVLVVEDEPDLASAIAISLRRDGYAVDVANDGVSALDRVGVNEYDLVCLDLNLPDTDGLDVCRQVVSMPTVDDAVVPRIIMLTARGGIDDRIRGLDQGADDYLVKPFSLGELGARVRALLRRDMATTSSVVRRAGIEFDSSRHEVRVNGTSVDLTTKEFALLRWFVLHPDVVHSSERLLEHVWDEHADPFTNTVRVTISNLRRKLAAAGGEGLIETLPGRGYVLRSER